MPIPVRVFAPMEEAMSWSCRIEIDWPEGRESKSAHGHDSIQALDLALRLVGALPYASDYHENGRPSWDKPGNGSGFPVTSNLRDLLIGDDAKHL